MRYIQRFDSASTEQAAIDAGQLGKPYIAFIEDGQYIDWNTKEATPDYSGMPMTFEVISGGTIVWNGWSNRVVQYKKNDDAWETTPEDTTVSFNVEPGDKLYFKGDNLGYGSGDYNGAHFSNRTGKFVAYGNMMSLFDDSIDKLTGPSSLNHFFQGCAGLVDASNLILPGFDAVTANYCFSIMFENCTSLVAAPALPATELGYGTYAGMFKNCSSLVSAPELPATILGEICYSEMFKGCTSLEKAPDLPANILSARSYYSMFDSCTNLNYIKCLATDISADRCTNAWVYNVSATGTFVKHPDAVSWPIGSRLNNGIPAGWTIIDADI